MKHSILVILFLLGSIATTNAQIKITGEIVDSNNNPIAFSTVILKSIDSDKIVTGIISDEDGKFTLQSSTGSYLFEISYLGYKTFTKNIEVNSNKDMGLIILTEMTNSLDQVVIISEKPIIERGADRLTFNVANSVFAAGGNMIDILKVTPGLKITADGISAIGKGNIRVMINGRIIKLTGSELVNFLNSIPANNIEKIEIIDTPPSKYAAEGRGGLINIIYKKGVDGLWNTSLNGSYRQGTYPLYSLGANTIYNNKGLSFSASLNLVQGSKKINENSTIFFPEQIWSNRTVRKDISKSINGRIALDYQYSQKSSVGFQYLGTVDRPDTEYNGLTEISNYNNEIDSIIQSKNFAMNKNYNHSFNLHHVSTLDSLGKTLSFDFDYFIFHDENESAIESKNFFAYNDPTGNIISALNNSVQNIENFSSKADVQLPLDAVNLSFGGKLSFTTTRNTTRYINRDQGTTITVPDQDNKFHYEENIQALYATAQKRFGEKWTAVFGLRLENTQTKGVSSSLSNPSGEETHKNTYLKLFPTAYVSYKSNQSNTFNLRYSRRISRPDFWELNPYKRYINAYIYAEGNPFLQPSFTHNVRISHAYKNNLSSSFFVSITNDGFGQIPGVDKISGEQFYTRDNYFKRISYGIIEGYTVKPFSWWKSYNQVFAFYHDVEFLPGVNLGTKPFDGFGLRYSSLNTFNLNRDKSIKGEVNFWYSPGSRYQIYKSTGASGLNLGVQWSPNENLELSAMVNDVFKQNIPTYTTFTDNTRQEYNIVGATRYFRISLNYSFGNKKVTKKERRFGNENEQERASK